VTDPREGPASHLLVLAEFCRSHDHSQCTPRGSTFFPTLPHSGGMGQLYSMGSIWRRSKFIKSSRGCLAFVLISKIYRQMYADTGIATGQCPGVVVWALGTLAGKPLPPPVRDLPCPTLPCQNDAHKLWEALRASSRNWVD